VRRTHPCPSRAKPAIVADFDLRPNGQVAIDDRWSALRFRPNREGEGRFTGGAK
jgi:hypothetical protein